MQLSNQSNHESFRVQDPSAESEAERGGGSPEQIESLHAIRCWEIAAVLPASREKDIRHDLRLLFRLQDRLLGCLHQNEGLLFRHQRGKSGDIAWEVELLAAQTDTSSPTVDAIRTTLRAIGNRLQFEEIPLKSLSASAKWVKIHPRSISVCTSTNRIGFGAKISADSMALWELPIIRQVSNEMLLADVIAHSPKLAGVEVVIRRWTSPADWGKTVATLHRLCSKAETPEIGAKMSERLASLERKGGWDVSCRVLLTGKRDPAGIARLLGPLVFNAEANVAKQSSKQRGASLSGVLPGSELPLLLPTPSLLEESGHQRKFNPRIPRLPKNGVIVGDVEKTPLRLPDDGRNRHTYVVGSTGTGKSTLLLNMIQADMQAGESVLLIDPHGDLYEAALASVPQNRKKDLFLLNPLIEEEPPGLNILDLPSGRMRHRHACFLVGELFRFFEETWNMRDAGGPQFEMYFRNTLMLLCMQRANSEEERVHYNIHAFSKVMANSEFRKRLMANCTEPSVIEFWEDIVVRTSGDQRLENYVPYICSKLNGLIQGGFIASLLGAERNEFRFDERMDRGEIMLLNLNKGVLGAYESRLLGTILMQEIFAAGLQRSLLNPSKRRPVNIYVDEFQNFVSDNVASMLSEARKFGLRLTLANQTLAQLRANPGRQNMLDAVLGNVGNMIVFRLGVPDAELLKPFTAPFTPAEMQRLPNFHAFARVLTDEGPTEPVVMRTRRPQIRAKARGTHK